jgi:alanine racemase
MGHLGCADNPADPCNEAGRARFAWGLETARAAGLHPAVRHLATTAAALTDPRIHHTLCRIGACLAGIDPSHTVRLRPALTLTAPIVAVRHVRAGTPVGYGAHLDRKRTRTWGCCRWATPTDCPAQPPDKPRSWQAGTAATLPG